MRKIEEGLHKVHALAGNQVETYSTPSTSYIQECAPTEPFLRVNLVSAGSPAEMAVRNTS